MEPRDLEVFLERGRENFDEMRLEDAGFVDVPRATQLMAGRMQQAIERWSTGEARGLAIESLDDRQLVGFVSTKNCDPRSGVFELGVKVLPEFRRRGYAADAIKGGDTVTSASR